MLTYEEAYERLADWHCLPTRYIDKTVFRYLTAIVAVGKEGKWEKACRTAIVEVLVFGKVGKLVDGRGIIQSFDFWKQGETVWFGGEKLPALTSDFFPHEPCSKPEPRLLTYEEAAEKRIAMGYVLGRDNLRATGMCDYLTALIAASGDRVEADRDLLMSVAAGISGDGPYVGHDRRHFDRWLEGEEVIWGSQPVPARDSDFFPWNRKPLGYTADGEPFRLGMTVYDPHSDGTDPVAVEVTSNHPVIIEDYSRCYSTRAAAQAMRQAKTFEQAEQACLRRRIQFAPVAHLKEFTLAIASVCTLTKEWDALEKIVRRMGTPDGGCVECVEHFVSYMPITMDFEQSILKGWIEGEETWFRGHVIPARNSAFFSPVPILEPHDDKALTFAVSVLPKIVEYFRQPVRVTATESVAPVDPLQAVEKACKCMAAMDEMIDWHQDMLTSEIVGFINPTAPITLSPEEVQELTFAGRLSDVLQYRVLAALRDLRNVIDAKIEELI